MAAADRGIGEDGPRYVAVEGPIGAGKTSLARRLAQTFESELVLERPEDNPFLERFYRDRRHAALPAQLCFLFQRTRQVQEFRQTGLFSPVRVADFLLEKDRLFAEVNLDPQELVLYEQIYDRLARDAPVPDLVIYLQAPVTVLLERIALRGIAYEKRIGRRYLERLNDAYARFFHAYDQAPLLIVNAGDIDPIHREADYLQLLSQVRSVRHGRHFFNPGRGLT
ncbi:deoxynucleoside kinase [soil metagenome]